MPKPNSKIKVTGDTHLPDVESEFAVEQRHQEQSDAQRGQAGELKDKDARTSDTYGKTRDSGEAAPSRK